MSIIRACAGMIVVYQQGEGLQQQLHSRHMVINTTWIQLCFMVTYLFS